MPPLTRTLAPIAIALAIALFASGCTKKASPEECDKLVDRFAELVVKEQLADAGAAQIESERARERTEAKGDPAFHNCTSEVQATEYACAMKAASSEALIKCLE